jgi:hypothetical protein
MVDQPWQKLKLAMDMLVLGKKYINYGITKKNGSINIRYTSWWGI